MKHFTLYYYYNNLLCPYYRKVIFITFYFSVNDTVIIIGLI